MTDFAIGTSLETLTDLSVLEAEIDGPDVLVPNHEYSPYAEYVTLGDKTEFGLGRPMAAWVFPLFDNPEHYQLLRAYCPGASARVYICTPDDQENFKIYEAIMVWPKTKRPENFDWSVNLVIEFRDLVEVEAS